MSPCFGIAQQCVGEFNIGGRRGPPPGAAPGQGAPGGPNMNQPGPGPQGAQGPRFVSSVDEIPANATDLEITESSGRNEIFATTGEPTNTVFCANC